jgi:hypothetical protein
MVIDVVELIIFYTVFFFTDTYLVPVSSYVLLMIMTVIRDTVTRRIDITLVAEGGAGVWIDRRLTRMMGMSITICQHSSVY